MGRVTALTLLLASAAFPATAQSGLPFDVALAEVDGAAFARCAAASEGVAVTWSLPPSMPEGRVDLLEEQRGFPRWRWRACAAVGAGSAVLNAAPGTRVIAVARASERDSYFLDGPFQWPREAASRRFGSGAIRTIGGGGSFPKGILMGSLLSASDSATRDPLCESNGEIWQCPAIPAAFRGALALCPAGGAGRYALIVSPGTLAADLEPVDGVGLPVRLEVDGNAPAREPVFRLVLARKHGYRSVPGLAARPLGGTAYWLGGKEAPAEALLEVSADGLATRRLSLDSIRASTPCGEAAVVRLPLAWEITGRVLDSDGSPLPGSTIILREPGEAEKAKPDGPLPAGGRVLQEIKTEETGAYRISRLEEQPYLLRFCHASRRCQERLVRPPFEPLEIRFDESGIVRGRVLSASGAPEPSALIEISPNLATARASEDALRLISLPVQADAQGRFELAVQAAGTFSLEASAPGGGAARREVAVTEISLPIDLGDIRLSRGGSFRARVPGCGGGEFFLVGPMNTDLLPQMKRFALSPEGLTVVELPGGGEWLAGAKCGGVQAYLEPDSLPRVEELWDLEVVFEIQGDEEGEDSTSR